MIVLSLYISKFCLEDSASVRYGYHSRNHDFFCDLSLNFLAQELNSAVSSKLSEANNNYGVHIDELPKIA